jgi:peptidoglycan-associated lipoprotein
MRGGLVILGTALALAASGAAAQRGTHIINRILPGRPAPPPVLAGIDALRADFIARSGSDTIYFGGDSSLLSAPAKATLAAQAVWLRQNPAVVVRIEGHADPADTRDHALAVGARRADAVRDYLVLLGVPAAQLSTLSMGKQKPAAPGTGDQARALSRRAVVVFVR